MLRAATDATLLDPFDPTDPTGAHCGEDVLVLMGVNAS